jgi:putative MATE family efflux protein
MKDLTQGKEAKLILYFTIPMLIGNAFQLISMTIDSIIVGKFIGKSALAAIGASFPVIFALLSMIIGIASGITTIIAQYYGAKDYDNVIKAVDTAYIFLFISSITVSVTGIFFAREIFMLLCLPSEVLPEATLYFQIYLGGTILMAGFYGTSAILRGFGDSKTPLYFMIIATIIGVASEIVFIVIFKWGIKGAAIATILSQGIAFLIAIIYLNKNHKYVNINFKEIHFSMDIFMKSLKIGLPSGLQQTFFALGMMALVRIVNGFGTDAIAAFTITGRIDSFSSLPAMNFSMALSSFVGQNIGAGKIERVKNGIVSTWLMISVITLIATAVNLIFSNELMSFFTHDKEVIRIGSDYLIIVGIFYIGLSIMFVNNGLFRGAGDTLVPMFITFVSLWLIRIPLAYFFSKEIGITGIWWAISISLSFGLIASTIYYLTGRWKNKTIVDVPAYEERYIAD